jgi:hypothetical protein
MASVKELLAEFKMEAANTRKILEQYRMVKMTGRLMKNL